MRLSFIIVLSVAIPFTPACGGSEGGSGSSLNPDISTPPPPGDAEGAEASGQWELEEYFTACSGICTVDTLVGTLSICDVGDTNLQQVTVTQTDGDLRIDGSNIPSRYDGGIDADGSFDVWGVGSQDGGNLDISVRAQGEFAGDDLTGLARGHSKGTFEGEPVDCRYDVEVTGTRL